MGTIFLTFNNKDNKASTTSTALAEWETEKTYNNVCFICPECKSKISFESTDPEELEQFCVLIRSFNFCPSCGQDLR